MSGWAAVVTNSGRVAPTGIGRSAIVARAADALGDASSGWAVVVARVASDDVETGSQQKVDPDDDGGGHDLARVLEEHAAVNCELCVGAPDAGGDADAADAMAIVPMHALPIVSKETLGQLMVFNANAPNLQPLVHIVRDAISFCSQSGSKPFDRRRLSCRASCFEAADHQQ